MSIDQLSSLCERILAYYHQRKWYGPDRPMNGSIGAYYEQGILQSRELTHDPGAGFEFPPATEEQLFLTEEAMGFPHPPSYASCIAKLLMEALGQEMASQEHSEASATGLKEMPGTTQ